MLLFRSRVGLLVLHRWSLGCLSIHSVVGLLPILKVLDSSPNRSLCLPVGILEQLLNSKYVVNNRLDYIGNQAVRETKRRVWHMLAYLLSDETGAFTLKGTLFLLPFSSHHALKKWISALSCTTDSFQAQPANRRSKDYVWLKMRFILETTFVFYQNRQANNKVL